MPYVGTYYKPYANHWNLIAHAAVRLCAAAVVGFSIWSTEAFASDKIRLAQAGTPNAARQDSRRTDNFQRENETLQAKIRELQEQLRNISEYEKSLTEQAIEREAAAIRERDAAVRERDTMRRQQSNGRPNEQSVSSQVEDRPGSSNDPLDKETFEQARGAFELAVSELEKSIGAMKGR